jgi:nicotinate-nucleotide adenylyltransferase
LSPTGLLGGAFDPPHNGHVALALAAIDSLALDDLCVLVTSDPGHKGVVAGPEARLALARAAFGLPGVSVELDDHRYTVDLLRERRWADPLFIVGADELSEFRSWKEPDEVLRLARLAVAMRPGHSRERLDDVLGQLERPDRVTFFEMPEVDVSSTEVRRRVAAGESIEELVPPPMAALVGDLDLYRR